jgi:hypothetical protein
MMEFLNNIVELGKATWRLFCMCPGICIFTVVCFVVMAFFAYCFIKDVVWTDKGGPIILR